MQHECTVTLNGLIARTLKAAQNHTLGRQAFDYVFVMAVEATLSCLNTNLNDNAGDSQRVLGSKNQET